MEEKKKKSKILMIFIVIVAIVAIAIVGIVAINNRGDNSNQNVTADSTPTITKHVGTIKYKNEVKEVEVVDYEINYFNLSDLFPDFDSSALHNVEAKQVGGTIRETKNAYSAGNNSTKLAGDILYIYGFGKNNIAEYKISDNFSITITDFITASSVNWNDYMRILPDANTSSVAGISLMTMKVEVNNISDEKVIGKITNVYLNNKPIASSYILDTTYTIDGKSKSTVNYPASSQALSSAKVKNVSKVALEVQLTDSLGNEVYKGIVSMDLE